MDKPLLIFDLDGTLIDSLPDIRTALNRLLVAHNREEVSMEQCKFFVGNGAPKLIERGFRATGPEITPDDKPALLEEFLCYYTGNEAEETTLYDGVIDTLASLQNEGFSMAVCTNKPQVPAQNVIEHIGLAPYFDLILGGDQLKHKKPHPQMIYWVIQKMAAKVENTFMIGDSPNDIEGARLAGVTSIAVPYGYRKISMIEMNADFSVQNFGEIYKIVTQS